MKFLSKVLIFFIVCSMFSGAVYAEEASPQATISDSSQEFQTLKSYEIVTDSLYNHERVNREDCVIAIMKLIGITPDLAEVYSDTVYYSSSSCPLFEDIQYNSGYLLPASESIALGDENHNFFPNRDVTVKEVSAFMVRCLASGDVTDTNGSAPKACGMSLDKTLAKAKNLGLIQSTDSFFNDGNATLTPNEFCVILNRMLYQKRYMYFDFYKIGIQYDTSGTGRYIDYLKKIK